MKTLINVIKGILIFIGFISIIAIIYCIISHDYKDFGSGIVFTIAVWAGYFALRYYFPSREDKSFYWKCPTCGTVLVKQPENQQYIDLLGGASVVGTVTCGKCNTSYSRVDVYSGKYDV